jgi:DNA-binding Lrp family transcriptional regulator/DNA-directed RNA polymerase subunit RPC12/RpoP
MVRSGKFEWIKNQIVGILAVEGALTKRQVLAKLSSLKVGGYPERIPASSFSECVDKLLKQGFIREEPAYIEERIAVNVRLTILGYSYAVYKMLYDEGWKHLLLKRQIVLQNFYTFLVNLYKMLQVRDEKRILERARDFLNYRPIDKLFFRFAVKTFEICPMRAPDYMELALENLSLEVMRLYLEKGGMINTELEAKEIYLRSIQTVGEIIGKYFLSEKKDFEICMKALKEAFDELNDLERKVVLQYFKGIIELKLYSIIPSLGKESALDLKDKIAKTTADEIVLPYYCSGCGNKGFTIVNMYEFMEHPIVRCKKCGKETNFITIGKIKIPE